MLFANALFPIDVTPLPTFTSAKELQFWKAEAPISVTLFGIVTEVMPVDWNALFPILVIVSGIVTLIMLLLFWNPSAAISVTV